MKNIGILYICLLLVVLPGCRRIIDWGKECFYQGDTISYDKALIAYFMKSFVSYDGFDTAARFDALWLSDEVRTEYARLHAYTYGKSNEFYQALLRRQLEENKHFITFYVLSVFDAPLGDPESDWRLFLRVNGTNIAPSEIKVVELLPEYKTFFGSHLTRFRVPYRVMFDAKDIDDNPMLTKDTSDVELILRSSCKELALHWNHKYKTNNANDDEESVSSDITPAFDMSSMVPEPPSTGHGEISKDSE